MTLKAAIAVFFAVLLPYLCSCIMAQCTIQWSGSCFSESLSSTHPVASLLPVTDPGQAPPRLKESAPFYPGSSLQSRWPARRLLFLLSVALFLPSPHTAVQHTMNFDILGLDSSCYLHLGPFLHSVRQTLQGPALLLRKQVLDYHPSLGSTLHISWYLRLSRYKTLPSSHLSPHHCDCCRAQLDPLSSLTHAALPILFLNSIMSVSSDPAIAAFFSSLPLRAE